MNFYNTSKEDLDYICKVLNKTVEELIKMADSKRPSIPRLKEFYLKESITYRTHNIYRKHCI